MEKQRCLNSHGGSQPFWFLLLILWMGNASIVSANGIYGNGTTARSMAMGGADVAWAADPLGAMTQNPAGLGFLTRPELDLGADAGMLVGNFSKAPYSSGNVDSNPRVAPSGAFGIPLGDWPVTVGISVVPDAALLANWHYNDPPGGLGGISYGRQQDESEIFVLRSALGAAVKINSRFSFGADVGLLYNENRLVTPYVFQNLQPSSLSGYDGGKTLLNLHTTGFGVDAQFGLMFRATTNLQFGLSYKTESVVHTSGDASGDPYAQFPPNPPGALAFHYDADVKNTFPQIASLGASWKFHPQWRGIAQVDWVGWSSAFHDLPVSMKNGTGGATSVLGTSFQDTIPLDWKNEFVYRVGVEYDVTENLALRLGYCYGHSPVPDATLTPMTAAIFEHTLTAGVGYHWRNFQFDVAYQYYFPVTQNVGTSDLLSGEYSNSSTTVSAHMLSVSTGITF